MLVFMWLYFLFTELPQTLSQFKKHIDLQKVAEITFRNEKFNVLKPTLHVITDHFKDFILQRRHEDVGTLFLDKNGFSHVWDGMEIPESKSLRKTELLQDKTVDEIQNNVTEIPKQANITSTQMIRDKPRRKKKIKEDVDIPEKPSLRKDPVLVTTTFFCPFFGLIRMTSDIDNYEETKTK